MNHAISLYFEEQLETAILAVWDRLSTHGIDTLATVSSGTIRPHITLAAHKDIADTEGLVSHFEKFGEQAVPMVVSFQSIGLFPSDESVLYFAPTVTRQLLATHTLLHQHLNEFSDCAVDYYTVDRWVPHSTISINVSQAQISHAVSAIAERLTFPLSGRVVEIGLDEVTHEPLSGRLISSLKI